MPQSDDQLPDEVSRTTIKNEMTALQKMGETLVEMPQSQLDKISLPGELMEAIMVARQLKSREAKRRQLQLVGKLMRHVEVAPIQAAIKNIAAIKKQVTAQFHQTEEWRERLIKDGDTAIELFLAQFQEADRQQLRQLVRQAQQNRKSGKNTGAEKSLFRYLNEYIK
jgi:ribosome-associated protein